MNPRLRLLLRVAGAILLAVGFCLLFRDAWHSLTYEGVSPAEPVGPPSLHLTSVRAYVIGFHLSGGPLAVMLGGALLLALSIRGRTRS